MAKPFVKWAGGKRQLLPAIREYYPPAGAVKIYCEPFLGGGAVLFDVIERLHPDHIYVSDANRALVATYWAVVHAQNRLVPILESMEGAYNGARPNERERMYYAVRDEFNQIIMDDDYFLFPAYAEIGARFLFLNRAGFNGLYRVNRSGALNVPWGRRFRVKFDYANLKAVQQALRGALIEWRDFRTIAGYPFGDDWFVYLDPPYAPVTTGSFTAYAGEFGERDQADLADLFAQMSQAGVKVLASNSAGFRWSSLYPMAEIVTVKARRNINSDGAGRGVVDEVLIKNFQNC